MHVKFEDGNIHKIHVMRKKKQNIDSVRVIIFIKRKNLPLDFFSSISSVAFTKLRIYWVGN